MAIVKRVRRLANPFKARRRPAVKTKHRRRKVNPNRKPKLTAKQIKYFGSKRQRAALSRKRNGTKRRKAVTAKRRRTVRNPALLVTLGAVNPSTKGKTYMARRRKAKTTTRRRRKVARKSNPHVKTVIRYRRKARKNPNHRRRRNPTFMGGTLLGKESLTIVAGGLVGVTATKLISSLIPASLKAPMGAAAPTVGNAVAAVAAGMLAQKLLPGKFADGVMFGGLMVAGSSLVNMVAPSLKVGDYPIGIAGLGELVPGAFNVPQNPLRLAPVPTQARVTTNGLTRAFGTAF